LELAEVLADRASQFLKRDKLLAINLHICSEKELWEYVAVHLKNRGIDTILVGGSVVSIYSRGAYHSGDLDFVKASMFVTKLEERMNEIGFKKHGRHYINPDCKHLFVEFPMRLPCP